MAATQSLLATGSVAIDTLETPGGTARDVLGGSASHFSLTASHFVPVQLVGVVGTDFPDEHLRLLRSREIDLTYLETLPGKTFRWHGRYTGPMEEAETLEVQLNVHEEFEPPFSSPGPTPDVVFLGNISPQFQRRTLEGLGERPDLVAADTMHLWIETQRDALKAFLKEVDLFFLNYEEALKLGESTNTMEAAWNLLDLGPGTVVIKKGEHGAIAVSRDRQLAVPGYPLDRERDPTGAGDTFAGGVMSVICSVPGYDENILQAGLVLGTLMASFTVEHVGTKGMQEVTPERLRKRYREYREIAGFSGPTLERLQTLLNGG